MRTAALLLALAILAPLALASGNPKVPVHPLGDVTMFETDANGVPTGESAIVTRTIAGPAFVGATEGYPPWMGAQTEFWEECEVPAPGSFRKYLAPGWRWVTYYTDGTYAVLEDTPPPVRQVGQGTWVHGTP